MKSVNSDVSSSTIEQEISVKINNKFLLYINSLMDVIQKTIKFDLYSRFKFFATLIAMVLGSTFFIVPAEPGFYQPDTSLNEILGLFQVFVTFCIIFSIIITASSASLISDELRNGTMLQLVGKPLTRTTIVLGKYLGVILYGLVICTIDVGLVCLIAFLKHPFYDIIPFFNLHLLYSLIIIFFFSTLSIGFSLIFKNPKVSTIIPIVIILINFLAFFAIKPILMYATTPDGVSYYEAFQVYHYDLGYQLMNVYIWMYGNLVSPIPSDMIYWLNGWGLYKVRWDEELAEDIITKTNYYLPQLSLLYLIAISVIVFLIGYFIFKRRDIN
jgi:ABC-type transport system involved in multi-copper enzyme maturation permease subunit